jgi:outer membrane protein OmpA-like peptidoglycan-associated protein
MPRGTAGIVCAFLLTFAPSLIAQDMPGSQDQPDIPRIEGSTIVGYSHSNYDEGFFITTMESRELQGEHHEGERTRIMYLGGDGLSPLAVIRNYQKALEQLGTVAEQFSCRDSTCYSNLGRIFVWQENNRIPTIFPNAQYLFHYSNALFNQHHYWYGTIESDTSKYFVSVYAANRVENRYKAHAEFIDVGQTVVVLEVVEDTDFAPTMTFVSAAEISNEIERTGHVALYGIHFDVDSHTLRSDSAPAVQEIAKALQDDPSLALYVVGHTDNQGGFEYNQSLSEQRAESVVQEIVNKHGITENRLRPVGVGLVAPEASNSTEEGRALNRRVELVSQ